MPAKSNKISFRAFHPTLKRGRMPWIPRRCLFDSPHEYREGDKRTLLVVEFAFVLTGPRTQMRMADFENVAGSACLLS
ncbi:hypothetical protein ACLOJK_011764 [Asimina triloba]